MIDPDQDTSKRVCEICQTPIPEVRQAWAHSVRRPNGRYEVAVTCKNESCMNQMEQQRGDK